MSSKSFSIFFLLITVVSSVPFQDDDAVHFDNDIEFVTQDNDIDHLTDDKVHHGSSLPVVRLPEEGYQVPDKPAEEYEVPQEPVEAYEVPQEPVDSYEVPQEPVEAYEVPHEPVEAYEVPQVPEEEYEVPAEEYEVPAVPAKPVSSYEAAPPPEDEYQVPEEYQVPNEEYEVPNNEVPERVVEPTLVPTKTFEAVPSAVVVPSAHSPLRTYIRPSTITTLSSRPVQFLRRPSSLVSSSSSRLCRQECRTVCRKEHKLQTYLVKEFDNNCNNFLRRRKRTLGHFGFKKSHKSFFGNKKYKNVPYYSPLKFVYAQQRCQPVLRKITKAVPQKVCRRECKSC